MNIPKATDADKFIKFECESESQILYLRKELINSVFRNGRTVLLQGGSGSSVTTLLQGDFPFDDNAVDFANAVGAMFADKPAA
jgi:hypothetical protein